MITVHHLADSRSQRILWLLEELGREYEVVRYERDAKTMLAPAALGDVHPLGKSPVIEDGALKVAESGAIVQHLIGLGGPMSPDGPGAAAADLEWLHAAEGSVQPLLLMALLFRLAPERAPKLARAVVGGVCKQLMSSFVTPRLAEQLGHVERTLAGRDWFAGGPGPTGADVMMIFPLEAATARIEGVGAEGMDAYPAIKAYVARVHDRPAYRRALARGGPYAYGPKDEPRG